MKYFLIQHQNPEILEEQISSLTSDGFEAYKSTEVKIEEDGLMFFQIMRGKNKKEPIVFNNDFTKFSDSDLAKLADSSVFGENSNESLSVNLSCLSFDLRHDNHIADPVRIAREIVKRFINKELLKGSDENNSQS